MEREIIVGKTYKHISGNYYRVICIANDSTKMIDNEPAQIVVYESLMNDHKIWVRPYELFNALVTDPDEVQKYRFELIEDSIRLDEV